MNILKSAGKKAAAVWLDSRIYSFISGSFFAGWLVEQKWLEKAVVLENSFFAQLGGNLSVNRTLQKKTTEALQRLVAGSVLWGCWENLCDGSVLVRILRLWRKLA